MKQKNFFRKQNIAVRALLLLMIVWTIWIIGSAITGLVRDIFVQSEEVHYATMEHVESGYGMLALTEHVIYAELDGTAELVIAEGDRVRKGNAVFRIGETYQYTNFAGRVSYRIDGLENITDIGTISALNMKEYYNAQQKKQKIPQWQEMRMPKFRKL